MYSAGFIKHQSQISNSQTAVCLTLPSRFSASVGNTNYQGTQLQGALEKWDIWNEYPLALSDWWSQNRLPDLVRDPLNAISYHLRKRDTMLYGANSCNYCGTTTQLLYDLRRQWRTITVRAQADDVLATSGRTLNAGGHMWLIWDTEVVLCLYRWGLHGTPIPPGSSVRSPCLLENTGAQGSRRIRDQHVQHWLHGSKIMA